MILACIVVYIPEAYYLDIITVIKKMNLDFKKDKKKKKKKKKLRFKNLNWI